METGILPWKSRHTVDVSTHNVNIMCREHLVLFVCQKHDKSVTHCFLLPIHYCCFFFFFFFFLLSLFFDLEDGDDIYVRNVG
jgi:hypothetical protein